MSEELIQSVLQDYGMAPKRTLPTINQFGQFQPQPTEQPETMVGDPQTTIVNFLPDVGGAFEK